MSLDHVLLGLLREPASGYDLGKAFEATAAHFWSAHLSQIYPTLKRMEAEGWLTSRREPSERGPARRVYRRTEAGREELVRWVRDGPEVDDPRLAYLGQLYFMGEVGDPEVTDRFVRRLRDRFRERLSALEAIDRQWAAKDPRYPDGLHDDAFHEHVTLRAGLRAYRARLAWCEETLGRLERRREADTADAGASADAAPGAATFPETGETS